MRRRAQNDNTHNPPDERMRRMHQLQIRAWNAQIKHLQAAVRGDETEHRIKRRAEIAGQILGSLFGIFMAWYLQPHLRVHEYYYGGNTEYSSSAGPSSSFSPATTTTEHSPPHDMHNLPLSSSEELQAAVDEYMIRGHPSHTVAKVYGWPIGNWNVTAIANFSALFSVDRNPNVRSFNEDLSYWDVSHAVDMRNMFQGAEQFDQDLSSWNTSSVTDMAGMFHGAHSFNGSLADWDTSSLTTMDRMFAGALVFNRNIAAWNTERVTNLQLAFAQAYAFDQDLSAWKTSRVTTMQHVFFSATQFNGNVSTWDVSNVRTMHSMFRNAHQFNGSGIEDWHVSMVHDMSNMFQEATRFDQDLSKWSVVNLIRAPNMFQGSALNRDLCAWRDSLPRKANVEHMFQFTKCPDPRDPDMTTTKKGPFCVPCK